MKTRAARNRARRQNNQARRDLALPEVPDPQLPAPRTYHTQEPDGGERWDLGPPTDEDMAAFFERLTARHEDIGRRMRAQQRLTPVEDREFSSAWANFLDEDTKAHLVDLIRGHGREERIERKRRLAAQREQRRRT